MFQLRKKTPIVAYTDDLNVEVPRIATLRMKVLMLLAVVFGLFAFEFHIVTSDSIPPGLYARTWGTVSRGSLVAVCLPEEVSRIGFVNGYLDAACWNGAGAVVKYVAGMPGDEIEVQREGIRINGVSVENSAVLERDFAGRALAHMPFATTVLGKNEVLLLSTHHTRSWDGRYFGPVSRDHIIATVAPVWTTR